MGFKDIRAKVISRLKNGFIQHVTNRSGDIDIKNLLLVGKVTVADVIEQINKTRGDQYETSPHHYIKEVEVHIFRPGNWYIKCYFIDPDVVFISVHNL
ncbi:MAG: hypothetical protein ISR65_07630 [Bacteriovoracaceae bacterium]|nr:hypothetical protein [Bacteriovoracaceae bacterium]